jgi:hypothetical protein
MKILLCEEGRNIFKQSIRNEVLHEISNDNEVRVVDFEMSKNLSVKGTMFPHCNILLMGRCAIRLMTSW